MPQPNLQNMLKQAQEMMAQQQKALEELQAKTFEASAGGGVVKVVARGDGQLESLTVDPDAVDPEDVEMLQDLVLAAVNEALRQAKDAEAKLAEGAAGASGFDPASALDMLGGLGGGMGGPGLPGGGPPMNRAARRKKR
ncbi:YbaB/EbfC family nucleoid-associated protein [Conexibacter sp. SYSU D00693]|uniref:YbaB/EbfC family nucleoid-associated protein n=1 Tax=Conexibacter sp. SYSU D00693 TaxID=2812560 RepID=UPI00196A91A3|nr:YbaB/EbfC family nucleoid-associated protein [Conexibacter sp. SYSU D00693]